jgi:hypothetical protein
MRLGNESAKKVGFVLLFGLIAFATQRINFSKVIGTENQYFNVFQFFGPISGGFLGPVMGSIAVLISQLIDFVAFNKQMNFLNFLRLFPMLFAAYYFGSRRRELGILVPAIAMILFITNPIAGNAWYYSLYWLIPIIAKLLPGKLFLRSFGATFTAHAVGSIVWLYTVPMTAEQWISLIPVVAYERGLFAIGIMVSYIAVNTLLDAATKRLNLKHIHIDPRYVAFKSLRLL